MAKRHLMKLGDWESVFGRLQELVMANSGEDPFEEIFKLLVVKLFCELKRVPDDPFVAAHADARASAAAMQRVLAQANQQWTGILEGDLQFRLTPEHLEVCLQSLRGLSLSDTHLEVLDGAFEYLVSKVSKGSKGQYFTPRHVIDCCVKMISPRPGETVLDPACGSGGFLVHVLNHVRAETPHLDTARYCGRNLWGFDFDRRAIRVAKALMLIAGDGSSNLFQLNSLLTPRANTSLFGGAADAAGPRLTIEDVLRPHGTVSKGFDIVLSNPPFAGKIKEPQIQESYVLAKKGRRLERDVLFLERCVDLLRPGGRLCIILPHNKFGSESWAYLREWLVRELRIVAVLGLGRNTFLPHTHQKTSVLFGLKRLKKESPDNDKVLFLVSDKPGKDTRGQIIARANAKPDDPSWLRLDHDLEEVVSLFQKFTADHFIPWHTANG